MQRNSYSHYLLIGIQNGVTTLENVLVIVQKVKHNYDQLISLLGIHIKN